MSDLCKRHLMNDGVTPNTSLSCCVWCAMEIYDDRLKQARRLLSQAVPNPRYLHERSEEYHRWKNLWAEFMTNTFDAATGVKIADAMNSALDQGD